MAGLEARVAEGKPLLDLAADPQAAAPKPPSAGWGALLVLYLAIAIDAADSALLAAVFRTLESDLSIGPAGLGTLSLVQSLSMALAAPVWGLAVDTGPRGRLLSWGVLSWGVLAIGQCGATSFGSFAFMRALNGVALALITPLSFSLIADAFPTSQRGGAFGWLNLAQRVGSVIGAQLATSLAASVGWRAPFAVFGLAALVLAPFAFAFVHDVRPAAVLLAVGAGSPSSGATVPRLAAAATILRRLVRNRTLSMLTLQVREDRVHVL